MISPLEGGAWSQIIKTDSSKGLSDNEAQTWFNSVSTTYFETLRTPLLSGRNFTRGDTNSGPKVAIVNQTLARRFFADLNPIGKTFRLKHVSGQFGSPIEITLLAR